MPSTYRAPRLSSRFGVHRHFPATTFVMNRSGWAVTGTAVMGRMLGFFVSAAFAGFDWPPNDSASIRAAVTEMTVFITGLSFSVQNGLTILVTVSARWYVVAGSIGTIPRVLG